ncbi:MAG: protoporphyrinogen oxidase [Elusimicrobia bacterium]|nr:protoporphyrinogen oxidase [Elusimicrobiota bacterium]
MSSSSPRVVILGAGITGLAAAYELHKRAARDRRKLEIVVLEASNRVGGKVMTETKDGVVFELGPDSFITAKPDALALVRELGLSGELVKTNESQKTIYVLSHGKLEPLPEGMTLLPSRVLPFLTTRLLSWKAKLRLALEPFIPAAREELDESLGSFVRRRLGREALEKIAAPMLAGIYAGDPEQMSLQSTFPQLKELELSGGIFKGMRAAAQRPKPSSELTMFMTLRGGLSRLVEALAHQLPGGTVRTGANVLSLKRRGSEWQVATKDAVFSADAVISALPANALAAVASDLDFELSCVLNEIPFVTTATVSLVYERAGFPDPLDGFGFIVPRAEGRAVTAATYTSTKFPERVAQGQVMVRCFMGGAGREETVAADEAGLSRTARKELAEILRLGETHPKFSRSQRWEKANPQYNVGHALRLKRIASCLQGHPGLYLSGCSYEGVGLPDCIRSGREAAAQAYRRILARGSAQASARQS